VTIYGYILYDICMCRCFNYKARFVRNEIGMQQQCVPLGKLPFAACLVLISVSVCVFLAEYVANHISNVTKLANVLKAEGMRQTVNQNLKGFPEIPN
jgi:hypothetical protein